MSIIINLRSYPPDRDRRCILELVLGGDDVLGAAIMVEDLLLTPDG